MQSFLSGFCTAVNDSSSIEQDVKFDKVQQILLKGG